MGTEPLRRWCSPSTCGGMLALMLMLMLSACDQRTTPWERSGVLLAVDDQAPPAGEQVRLLPPGVVPGDSPLGSPCAVDRNAFYRRYGYDLPSVDVAAPVPDPAAAADGTLQSTIDSLAGLLQALGGKAQQVLPSVVSPRTPDATSAGHAHLQPRPLDDTALLRRLEAVHGALRSLMASSQVVEDDGRVVAAADGDATWRRRRERSWAAMDLAMRQLLAVCPRGAAVTEVDLLQRALSARQALLVEPGIVLSAQRLRQCCDQAAATPHEVDAYHQALTCLETLAEAFRRRCAQLVDPQAVPTVVYAAPVPGPSW